MKQLSLFDDQRLTLDGAIELSLTSLNEYGQKYRHWAVAYSGGKDSSATATFVAWVIKNRLVSKPDSLTVLFADTRQEYPPLYGTAMRLLDHLAQDGFDTQVVLPPLDKRFYVYMFGRGIPPPTNTFRWCTRVLKIEPMTRALEEKSQTLGEKFLLINGVRLGESAARDQRIAVSCSKDSGECGQGWFEVKPPGAAGDTLAPLLHWRLCHIFDWCYFEDHRHGYPEIADIADVYGDGDVRTGCIGCNLVERDVPLERLVRSRKFSCFAPLLEIKPLLAELRQPQHRLRKYGVFNGREGQLGPLTMAAREYGLSKILDIQKWAGVDLINADELARIYELWSLSTWPNGWTGDEPQGDQALGQYVLTNDGIFTQGLLVR